MKTGDFLKEKMAAMKAGDKLKKDVLTNLLSGLNYAEKDLGRPLKEDEVLKHVAKEKKKLQEAMDLAQGRPDAQEGLAQEIRILEAYLPEELSDEDLQVRVHHILEEQGIGREPKQKGPAMQAAMKAVGSQADGKRIGQAVDAYLMGQ